MDIHIWYTLLSALVGGVMGARDRLGEVLSTTYASVVICKLDITLTCANLMQIRSIEMLHKRFESFPEAFAKTLSPQRSLIPLFKIVSF